MLCKTFQHWQWRMMMMTLRKKNPKTNQEPRNNNNTIDDDNDNNNKQQQQQQQQQEQDQVKRTQTNKNKTKTKVNNNSNNNKQWVFNNIVFSYLSQFVTEVQSARQVKNNCIYVVSQSLVPLIQYTCYINHFTELSELCVHCNVLCYPLTTCSCLHVLYKFTQQNSFCDVIA